MSRRSRSTTKSALSAVAMTSQIRPTGRPGRLLVYLAGKPPRQHDKSVKGLFGWAVAVKKVAVGCELWKKLL